jgi:hypothetical protein
MFKNICGAYVWRSFISCQIFREAASVRLKSGTGLGISDTFEKLEK